ncbi:MAG: hypothetical protein AAF696_29795 [Bacteroidota bacterium]
MKKSISILLLFFWSGLLLSQKYPEFSLSLQIQPQVSSLQPYDEGFISQSERINPGFSFGLEISRSINKDLEIVGGYHLSSQAGNFSLVECDRAYVDPLSTNSSAEFFPGTNRIIACPLPRHRINIAKIPLGISWKFIQKDRFMSRLGLGPQLQFTLTNPGWGLHPYKRAHAAMFINWVNHFKLSNSFSLLAGLRADRSLGALDRNPEARSIGSSLGLFLGLEYSYWKE